MTATATPTAGPQQGRTQLPIHPVSRFRQIARSSGAQRATVVAFFIASWDVWLRIADVNPLLVPTPLMVWSALGAMASSGDLAAYTYATVRLLGLGLAIGIAIAAVLTALAVFQPLARTLLMTASAMFNPVPAVALLPLALLWFGVGGSPIVFVVVYSVVWSLALNLNSGFESVPVQLRWVGQNLGLHGWRYVRDIYLPASLPSVMTGLRIAWAYGWRTVIAAELIFGAMGGRGGLGWMIVVERYNLRTDRVFAGLVTIIAVGLTVDAALSWVERRTVRKWGMTS